MEKPVREETFLIPGSQSRSLKQMFHHLIWRVIAPLPDKLYLKLKYWVIKGEWPDIDRPRTFCEKVQARKLYDRKPIYAMLVDKAGVKAFVAEKLGHAYVTPTYWVGTDLAAVDWTKVSLPAVVKPTHASTQGRFLYTQADIRRLLEDNPAPAWLKLDHAHYNREWAYSAVEPQVLIEAMLVVDGGVPWDYRFFTFDGVVSHIEVNMRVDGKGYACHYTPDWVRLPLHDPDYLEAYPGEVPKPARFDEMMRIVEAVGRDFDFLRIDLYASDDWVRLGEVTLYPDGGFMRFDPADYDRLLGEKWTLGFKIPNAA
ncbi:polysaccharide biosynthesis protein [Shinella sp. CPCC 101442]|uniref:ATP-grasp fold amidoligase family protein n=1 Tax=Shinella sp. CPCC 101442 TaxID=2932265 RepID=UPI0021532C2C|nr:ATP-grasp fold amidoligase family protein [Shinella sp. CPCC 101442]MCR6497797.1 polysaccharide biosynthesis protein [Shinella sp. CPCC 101442]